MVHSSASGVTPGYTGPVTRSAAAAKATLSNTDVAGASTSSTAGNSRAGPGAGSRPGGSGSGHGSGSGALDWQRVVLAFVSTVSWMFFSSSLIILNKHLYRLGFEHPCFVTGMGQVFSAAGGYWMVKGGLQQLRPMPSARQWATRLAPIIVSTALTMFFGNAAYLTLSVAFIQILKAFTPALTLVLCVLFGLEKPQWPLALSVLLIAGGTASAVLVESGTPSFALSGFVHFMLSSITEAARVVGAEVLLGAQRFNNAEALVYIGGPTAVLLLLWSAVTEGPFIWGARPLPPVAAATLGAWQGTPAAAAAHAWGPGTGALLLGAPLPFLAAFTMSFLVNMSCFFAIQYTSSLTFKVAGCVKNVAVVWYSIIMHGELVSWLQFVGYFVSVIGFAMYSRLKLAVRRSSSSSSQKHKKL